MSGFGFYVNGKRVDDCADISVKLHAADPTPEEGTFGDGPTVTHVSASAVMPITEWRELVLRLTPHTRKVSGVRLLERVRYGGRKGRSAMRRLLRLPPHEQQNAALGYIVKHGPIRRSAILST